MLRRSIHTRSLAITLPGQGLLRSGLLTPYAKFRDNLIQEELSIVSDVLGEEFTERLFDDSDISKDWLKRTSIAQPAIMATSYVIYTILKRQYGVDLVNHSDSKYILGHSLGEYTALLLNKQLDFPSALKLVRRRGSLMEKLVEEQAPTKFVMKALLFKPTNFDNLVERIKADGILANVNSRNQIVVSGAESKVKTSIDRINSEKKLILKAIDLPVSIPFHNELLKSIQPVLVDEFESSIREGELEVVSNLTGLPSKGGADTFSNTIGVNSQPVQWVKSMDFLLSSGGVTDVVNIGPGDVLQGINSKYETNNHRLDSIEDMELLVNHLS